MFFIAVLRAAPLLRDRSNQEEHGYCRYIIVFMATVISADVLISYEEDL